MVKCMYKASDMLPVLAMRVSMWSYMHVYIYMHVVHRLQDNIASLLWRFLITDQFADTLKAASPTLNLCTLWGLCVCMFVCLSACVCVTWPQLSPSTWPGDWDNYNRGSTRHCKQRIFDKSSGQLARLINRNELKMCFSVHIKVWKLLV